MHELKLSDKEDKKCNKAASRLILKFEMSVLIEMGQAFSLLDNSSISKD
jgi:hypothetical protein